MAESRSFFFSQKARNAVFQASVSASVEGVFSAVNETRQDVRRGFRDPAVTQGHKSVTGGDNKRLHNTLPCCVSPLDSKAESNATEETDYFLL